MAEFNEIVKHRNRMCKSLASCAECVLNIVNTGNGCSDLLLNSPEVYERAVLKWAAEHPEPLYPTWKQWQDKMFPDHDRVDGTIFPCVFMSKERAKCDPDDCEYCNKQRIPAEIAEKLGVKPGEEWRE